MDKKLISLFKNGNIVIPLYLLQKYKEFKLDFQDFIFLMYLYNLGDGCIFNPNKISEDIGFSVNEVMQLISNLSEKNYIELKVKKDGKGITEEVISLDRFYSKLTIIMMDDFAKKDTDATDCFSLISKEFGRTLKPMEYEIIKAWISSGHSDEIIMEAVREATFSGTSSFRYIDKILYEWSKKGIKTREDVEKNRKNFKKTEEKEEELFDYNWFEDDDYDNYD